MYVNNARINIPNANIIPIASATVMRFSLSGIERVARTQILVSWASAPFKKFGKPPFLKIIALPPS